MRHLTLWHDALPISHWFALSDWNLGRVFDQTFGFEHRDEETVVRPECEFKETESHFMMSMDLPGVAKKDIHIEVTHNQLVISGERKSENRALEKNYRFHRAVTLPAGINSERSEAQYQDGVLTVALAKAEAAKKHQIKITEWKNSFFGKLLGAVKESDREEQKATSDATEV